MSDDFYRPHCEHMDAMQDGGVLVALALAPRSRPMSPGGGAPDGAPDGEDDIGIDPHSADAVALLQPLLSRAAVGPVTRAVFYMPAAQRLWGGVGHISACRGVGVGHISACRSFRRDVR